MIRNLLEGESVYLQAHKYCFPPMGKILIFETHPSHGTENNNGDEDDGQDASQGNNRTGIGRGRYGLHDVIDWWNKVDANHNTNHNADESCNIYWEKPPVEFVKVLVKLILESHPRNSTQDYNCYEDDC